MFESYTLHEKCVQNEDLPRVLKQTHSLKVEMRMFLANHGFEATFWDEEYITRFRYTAIQKRVGYS